MAKYIIGIADGYLLNNSAIGDDWSTIGFKKDIKDTFEEAVDHFLKRWNRYGVERDPFEFALNPKNYKVVILTNRYIITHIMTVDEYSESITGKRG